MVWLVGGLMKGFMTRLWTRPVGITRCVRGGRIVKVRMRFAFA